MPAMVLLGRRWLVGSDDLAVPFACLGFVDLFWAVAFGACLIRFAGEYACSEGGWYLGYIVLNIGTFALLFVTSVAIVYYALQGTILDPRPRRRIRPWLYAHGILMLAEVGVVISGIILFARDTSTCAEQFPKMVTATEVITYINMSVIIVLGIATCCIFDPLSVPWSVDIDDPVEFAEWKREHGRRHTEWWLLRFRFLFRTPDEQAALQETARLFADYFDDIDVTPSDLAAGLVLALEEQRLEAELADLRRQSSSSPPPPLAPSGADAGRSVTDAESTVATTAAMAQQRGPVELAPTVARADVGGVAHYCKYAEAIYGWPLYVNANPCRCFKLTPTCSNCCGGSARIPVLDPESGTQRIVGDNCLDWNAAALREDSIVFVTFENALYRQPYLVAVDHEKKAVVVAVRGSLSLGDALVDMQLNEVKFDVSDGPDECWAHEGFMKAAKNLLDDLAERRLLQRLLLETAAYRDYELVIVGHSLGAALASLLAILLRSQFPTLRCYAYSPPGCVLSENAAKYAENFVISVVLGDDIIPRLGRQQLDDAKDHMYKLMAFCPRNKTRVLFGATAYLLPRRKRTEAELERLLRELGPSSAGTPHRSHERLRESDESEDHSDAGRRALLSSPGGRTGLLADNGRQLYARYERMQLERSHVRPMYPPGRILRIARVPKGTASDSFEFVARWGSTDELRRITISVAMLMDHLPDKLGVVLRDLARKYPEEAVPDSARPRPSFPSTASGGEHVQVTVHRASRVSGSDIRPRGLDDTDFEGLRELPV